LILGATACIRDSARCTIHAKLNRSPFRKHWPTKPCLWIVRSEAMPRNCCRHGVAERSTRDTEPWWNAETSIADAASYPGLPTHMLRAHEQANGNELQRSTLNVLPKFKRQVPCRVQSKAATFWLEGRILTPSGLMAHCARSDVNL